MVGPGGRADGREDRRGARGWLPPRRHRTFCAGLPEGVGPMKGSTLAALALALAAAGCSRPVDGRRLGATILSEVRIEPAFAREGIPIDISFRAIGAPPARVNV